MKQYHGTPGSHCVWLVGFALVLAGLVVSAAQAALSFGRPFSPQEGLTASVEQPWRQEICLNGSWQFQPVALPADYDIARGAPQLPAPRDDAWSATPIRIPSPWNVNSYARSRARYFAGEMFPSYPEAWDDARMGWLRKTFRVPAEWRGQRLILHFEAVCGYAQVFVNGEAVIEHFDNSLPFAVDVTDFVDRAGENTILVGVRQADLFDVPGPYGKITYPSGSLWTRRMIGIWGDVFLRALPALRVEDIVVRSLVDQRALELELTVRNDWPEARAFRLGGEIKPWTSTAGRDPLSAAEPRGELGAAVASVAPVEHTIGPRSTTTVTLRRAIKDELKLWTPETPNLYGLVLDTTVDGAVVDRFYQRFGWRQWAIVGRDVTLNGQVYQLRGESDHVGGVAYLSRRYAWAWYTALKDLHVNAVRLHANIRPRFYMEVADEIGMAILPESEIYASTVDINYFPPETWQRFEDHLGALVRRDRNYASVFGWSIANEILSALWWNGTPRRTWPQVVDRMVGLSDFVLRLDPTRDWISSDGDGDFHGRIPTFSYHYGKPQDWRRQAPADRPFGVGEGGSMVWGSPSVFAAYNGERSYESREGMQEGIAIELYYYLVEQRKLAAFCSVFTLTSTCFERLPLGRKDEARPLSAEDGIVFGPLVEGQPGMQPERIPPYAIGFNPGFDPALPLYRKTVVFDAVEAAYDPAGPRPSPWDHRVESPPRPAPPPATLTQVNFVGDAQGALHRALEASGVAAGAFGDAPLLVIDGASLTEPRVVEARRALDRTLAANGTAFLWIAPENLALANTLLPAPVTLVSQEATGLFADRAARETASLALADLYFQDQSDPTVVRHVLDGAFVQDSDVLLATNSITHRFYSIDAPRRAPVLIRASVGGGRLLVTTLPPDVRSERRLQLLRGLFANLGVRLAEPDYRYDTGFDGAGFLNQALMIGAFQGATYPQILDRDFLGGEAQANPRAGDRAGNREWTLVRSLGDGLFDFFRLGIAGTENSRARMPNSQASVLTREALDANHYLEVIERVSGTNPGTNSVAYLSFWLHAPRAIAAGELTMQLRADDGTKIWVNTAQIHEDRRIGGPGLTDPRPVPLALREGWNRVLVKIGQLDGPWNFSLRLESPDTSLPATIRAAATKP